MWVVVADALLILALLNHACYAADKTNRAILSFLAIIPLAQLISFAIPLADVSIIAMIQSVLLITMLAAVRLTGLSWTALYVDPHPVPAQYLIALSGIPLGAAAFVLLKPGTAGVELPPGVALVTSAAVVGFAGVLDELLFRSMLQATLRGALGRAGIVLSTLLFVSTYLGSASWPALGFITVVAVYFALCVVRTRSVLGVAAAHGLLNVGWQVIWPLLWR